MVDAHTDDFAAPPVTICCAASDGAAVREAAEALMARGHQVELVAGVDVDPDVLTRSIAAQRGRGLYVLCRSHALDRNAVDQLREILRTHDVPFGRTLTLAVDTQRPREVEERIVSVLRRMVTGRADGRPRAWGAHAPTHEEDPDTTVRRPGGSPAAADPSTVLVGLGTEPENADPYASTSQIEVAYRGNEIVAPPPSPMPYTGAEHTAIGPAPQPPTASTTAPPPGGGAPGGGALRDAGAGMLAAPMPMPMPGASPSRPSPPPSLPSAPPLRSAMSEAMAAFTPPPVSVDDSSADFETPMTMGGRMGRALGSPAGLAVALGGLAVVVLVVLAGFLLGDDGENGSGTAASADAATKAEASRKPDAKVKTDGKPEPTQAADATPKPDVQPKPETEPETDSEPAPRPAAAADPGDALPSRTFAPEDDPPDVVAALRSREVRAIDVFVVAPERKGTLTFDQAVAYCQTLEIAGLTGWRVPAIGELNAVATAKMLGKAIYWSSTAGDSFGDLRLVLGTKKATTIVAVPKSWDGAKIVCIRPRQP